ncbi:MAG: RNA 2',3'-cyclic phosphodiesterase [Oscillospiraceae bacterium]|nr:RNA 2',3'-cyclic phosphodiesterase [Oscillospiraceae bacterium]
MRIFIAVNFPEDVKDALCGDMAGLRERSVTGNFSLRENLHLTLAFLGEVHPRRVSDIRKVMDSAICPASDAGISGFGSFGRGGERLLWRGLRLDPKVRNMRDRLIAGLKDAGFTPDDKPFKPHITVARRACYPPEFSEKDFASSLSDVPFRIEAISLMRSERIGGKLTYTEMYRASLPQE